MCNYKYLILAIFTILVFGSCDKDECSEASFNLSLNIYVEEELFNINTSMYDDYMNRKYRVELLKFYLSNCALEKKDGTIVPITDVVLVDAASEFPLSMKVTIETGTYVNLNFSIGLDSIMNASDPASFLSTHPLSIANNTYWSWASKYKFFMMEGRVDSQSDGNPDAIFSYHSGFNSLYREISLPLNDFCNTSAGSALVLQLNLASVVNGSSGIVDFVDQPFSHAVNNYELVEVISNNLLDAFTVYESIY